MTAFKLVALFSGKKSSKNALNNFSVEAAASTAAVLFLSGFNSLKTLESGPIWEARNLITCKSNIEGILRAWSRSSIAISAGLETSLRPQFKYNMRDFSFSIIDFNNACIVHVKKDMLTLMYTLCQNNECADVQLTLA